jgi:hypothetical protein
VQYVIGDGKLHPEALSEFLSSLSTQYLPIPPTGNSITVYYAKVFAKKSP